MIFNRKDYYSTEYVLFNLVNQLKYTYLSSRKVSNGKIKVSRYYLGYSLDLLKKSLNRLDALENTSVKLYFDLSIWKDERGFTPMFNYNNKIRENDKQDFNDNFEKYFKGYSFAIDLDSEDINDSYKDAKIIKNMFDEYKLPYSIKFSGSRGFHFLIDDKWLNNRIKPKNKVLLCQKMAKVIMGSNGLKSHNDGGSFDDSIYDDRRIFKLAYSLVNNDGKEYVCLPLNDEQFNKFKLEHMELSYIMNKSKIRLFKRGILERDHGLSEKELKSNMDKFVRMINGKSS